VGGDWWLRILIIYSKTMIVVFAILKLQRFFLVVVVQALLVLQVGQQVQQVQQDVQALKEFRAYKVSKAYRESRV
jgi:hypothetical protein